MRGIISVRGEFFLGLVGIDYGYLRGRIGKILMRFVCSEVCKFSINSGGPMKFVFLLIFHCVTAAVTC